MRRDSSGITKQIIDAFDLSEWQMLDVAEDLFKRGKESLESTFDYMSEHIDELSDSIFDYDFDTESEDSDPEGVLP